jgi:Sec-independent protein translocase protein TatA
MKGLGSGIKEFKNAAKEEPSADKKDETENKKKSPDIIDFLLKCPVPQGVTKT